MTRRFGQHAALDLGRLVRDTTNSLTVIGTVRSSTGETVSTSSAPTVTLNAQDAAAAAVTVRRADDLEPALDDAGPAARRRQQRDADIRGSRSGPDGDVGRHRRPLRQQRQHRRLRSLAHRPGGAARRADRLRHLALVADRARTRSAAASTSSRCSRRPRRIRSCEFSAARTVLTVGTVQATGTATGSAMRFRCTESVRDGSVNQNDSRAVRQRPSDDQVTQIVGSGSFGNSILTKLRYQLGGPNGYGYLQFNFRNQNVSKDESALLTTYHAAGLYRRRRRRRRSTARDSRRKTVTRRRARIKASPARTWPAHNANYGFDAQLPLGNQLEDGAPATVRSSAISRRSGRAVGRRPRRADAAVSLQSARPARRRLAGARPSLHQRHALVQVRSRNGEPDDQLRAGSGDRRRRPIGPPIGGVPVLTPMSGRPTRDSAARRRAADADSRAVANAAVGRAAIYRRPVEQLAFLARRLLQQRQQLRNELRSARGHHVDPDGQHGRPCSRSARRSKRRSSRSSSFRRPARRVPIGGIIFIGNPNLQPDSATDYDLGAEQIFGGDGHPFKISGDLYQSEPPIAREPARGRPGTALPDQTQSGRRARSAMPVNAGNAIYRGIELSGDHLLSSFAHLLAGWTSTALT